MAQIIEADGTVHDNVEPAEGKYFSGNELNEIVGGWFQLVPIGDGRVMVVNEEGHIHKLPKNHKAGAMLNRHDATAIIVGTVLICKAKQLR